MRVELTIDPTVKRGALNRKEAMHFLGVGTVQLWKLVSLGKIVKTTYGTYPLSALEDHLREEIENAQSK